MNIADRYLIRQMSKTTFGVLLVLLMLTLGNTLVALLERAVSGEISSAYVFPLLGISMANYLIMFLGLSLMLGMMLTFGRLYKDAEMSAMVACGMSPKDFYRPIAYVAVPIALFALWLSVWAVPWLGQQKDVLSSEAELPSIEKNLRAGEFNTLPDGVIYLESMESSEMQNVFVAYKTANNARMLQVADKGRIVQGEQQLSVQLNNGRLYKIAPKAQDMSQTEYQQYIQYVNLPDIKLNTGDLQSIGTIALMRSDNLEHNAEWQWRLATPISCLLLALLAFPLSHTAPRKGMFSKVGYGVLVYMLYNNVLGVAKNMISEGNLSPYLGMWWVHAVLAVFIVFMTWKHYGEKKTKVVQHDSV